jgi:dCTP deaminase
MILSNLEIIEAVKAGDIIIDPSPELPASGAPPSCFDSTALDLRLGDVIQIPKRDLTYSFNLKTPGRLAQFLKDVYETHPISQSGGFTLEPRRFALANTFEKVTLPINPGRPCYAARIEGRSSYARCGLMVHLTAPTIHAGFDGRITLELINLGDYPITLYPMIPICQLIFETVQGEILFFPSQFQGQKSPEGM